MALFFDQLNAVGTTADDLMFGRQITADGHFFQCGHFFQGGDDLLIGDMPFFTCITEFAQSGSGGVWRFCQPHPAVTV